MDRRTLLSLRKQRTTKQQQHRHPSKRSLTDSKETFKQNRQGELLSIDMIYPPSSQQLLKMERDPVAALLNMATNSGLGRFPETDYLFLEDFNNNKVTDQIPAHLKSLASEIENNISDEDRRRIVKDFLQAWDISAPLYACACCGVRAYEMGKTKFHQSTLEDVCPLQFTQEQVGHLQRIPEIYRYHPLQNT